MCCRMSAMDELHGPERVVCRQVPSVLDTERLSWFLLQTCAVRRGRLRQQRWRLLAALRLGEPTSRQHLSPAKRGTVCPRPPLCRHWDDDYRHHHDHYRYYFHIVLVYVKGDRGTCYSAWVFNPQTWQPSVDGWRTGRVWRLGSPDPRVTNWPCAACRWCDFTAIVFNKRKTECIIFVVVVVLKETRVHGLSGGISRLPENMTFWRSIFASQADRESDRQIDRQTESVWKVISLVKHLLYITLS